MNEIISKVNVQLDESNKIIGNLFTILLKISTFMGGTLAFLYFLRIGYFPTDLSFSQGVIFTFLTVVFGVIYLFTIASIALFSDLTIILVLKFLKSILGYFSLLNTIKSYILMLYGKFKFSIEKIGFFIIALFWLAVVYKGLEIITLFDIGILFVILIGILLFKNLIDIKFLEKSLAVGKSIVSEEQKQTRRNLKLLSMFAFVCLPIIVWSHDGKLLESSMQILHITKRNSIVHIQQPYANYLDIYGINHKKQSPFGNDYVQVENVDILLNGIGSKIILRVYKPSADGKTAEGFKLIVPNDKIFIVE